MKQSDKKLNKFYSKEDIEKLNQKMDEDMEDMLSASEPLPPHEFSQRYEDKLRESLIERLGKEKAEEILRRRANARKNQVCASDMAEKSDEKMPENDAKNSKAQKSQEVHPLKTCKKLSGQSRKKKTSHFPIPGFTKAAASVLIIIAASLIFGKNEAQASWWENMQFIVKSYKEYSKIEAYEDVYSEDTEYPSTIEKKYVPTKVAEGYEEVARDEVSKEIAIIYQDPWGKLQYVYIQRTKDMGEHINTENTMYTEINTLYGKAYYCKNLGEYQLYWDYDGYMFSLQGDLILEEMIKIVESLQLEKGEN